MSGTHSIVAPSGAAIWVNCAAAPRMQAPYASDPPTPESLEGDAAHWLACNLALLRQAGDEALAPGLGSKAPNGIEITQDMIDGAELFADVVGPGANHEKRVLCEMIHSACWGTPDADRFDPRVLRLYDYKFGHRFVEVFENWQCVGYAIGRLAEIPRTEWPSWVEFVIVQPRSYHPEGPVRRWRATVDEIVTLANQMHVAAAAAIDEAGRPRNDAKATTGEHCGDCRARHECTSFQAVAARIVDIEMQRTERYNLPPAQLGAELSYLDAALERLNARREGLAIQADTHIRSGRPVPGYEFGPGRSVEKWRDDVTVNEVATFAATLDPALSLMSKPELITPTQARAELKRRRLPVELLDGYAIRPPGAMRLQPSSTIKARKAFGVQSK